MNCHKNIVFNKKSWYVKLYLWSCRRWCGFSGTYYIEYDALNTDLCSFLRAIFLYMPIVFLAYSIAAVALMATIFVVPSILYGFQAVSSIYAVSCAVLFIGHLINMIVQYLRSFWVAPVEQILEPDDELSLASIVDSYRTHLNTPSFPDIVKLSVHDYFDGINREIVIE